MMDYVKEVTLCEVGPRDGLQNEKKIFSWVHSGETIREIKDKGGYF